MALNQHDRDRLLVAVHDGLDAVIGDKVRWKPPGKSMFKRRASKGTPRWAKQGEQRSKQWEQSKGYRASMEKAYQQRPMVKFHRKKSLAGNLLIEKRKPSGKGGAEFRRSMNPAPSSARRGKLLKLGLLKGASAAQSRWGRANRGWK